MSHNFSINDYVKINDVTIGNIKIESFDYTLWKIKKIKDNYCVVKNCNISPTNIIKKINFDNIEQIPLPLANNILLKILNNYQTKYNFKIGNIVTDNDLIDWEIIDVNTKGNILLKSIINKDINEISIDDLICSNLANTNIEQITDEITEQKPIAKRCNNKLKIGQIVYYNNKLYEIEKIDKYIDIVSIESKIIQKQRVAYNDINLIKHSELMNLIKNNKNLFKNTFYYKFLKYEKRLNL